MANELYLIAGVARALQFERRVADAKSLGSQGLDTGLDRVSILPSTCIDHDVGVERCGMLLHSLKVNVMNASDAIDRIEFIDNTIDVDVWII